MVSPAKSSNQLSKSNSSFDGYLNAIKSHYIYAVTIMICLIAGNYGVNSVALNRNVLQHDISYLTSNQFIRFQRLANQTRALMRASVDPNISEYITAPIVSDILFSINEIHQIRHQLDSLYEDIDNNFLEQINHDNGSSKKINSDLQLLLEEFLQRAERVANAGTEERKLRYSFWGPIDFSVSSDSTFMRSFHDLIEHVHSRSAASISNAKLINSILLSLIIITIIMSCAFLFIPLIKKLRFEHKLSIKLTKRLNYLAHTDYLTGLSNRANFNYQLSELIKTSARDNSGFSLLIVDLDFFKSINDGFGHPTGDAVLTHASQVLSEIRFPNKICARLGGDEFAVLLPGLEDPNQLRKLSLNIVSLIGTMLEVDGHTLQISASIGGAIAPIHAQSEAELIHMADLALYNAKKQRNTVYIFDEVTLASQFETNRLLSNLTHAADKEEYVVHYQPKIDLKTGQHIGFEALVRWQHPEFGLLPPNRFIPLMNGTHLIFGMTRSVIQMVAQDIKRWKQAGIKPGPVAINIPEVLLVGQEGVKMFRDAITEYGLSWCDFAIEMTEDVFLDRQSDNILKTVSYFREQGMSLSLDDFGTGFASLVHLRDFPFDELKIDRSFVNHIGKDVRSEQIIHAMIDLARSLGKHCVAEGIETEEQQQFLLKIGCDVGQGYLFSRPQSPLDTSEYLKNIPIYS